MSETYKRGNLVRLSYQGKTEWATVVRVNRARQIVELTLQNEKHGRFYVQPGRSPITVEKVHRNKLSQIGEQGEIFQ